MSHDCKRFRTVLKRNGVRHVVKCRVCGKKRLLAPVHAAAAFGPAGRRLPS